MNSPAIAFPFRSTERPRHSPWGQVDHARERAPGIWRVETPGHGGYMLSPERVSQMPAMFKFQPAHFAGHFEEDCDWALVALAYPTCFSDVDQFHARRTIAGTAKFTFRGFDPAPWLTILAEYPPIDLASLSRADRIIAYKCSTWSRDISDAEAAQAVDLNLDLTQDANR